MIIPWLPQKASDQKGCGVLKLILTVWLSSLSIREISRYEPLVTAAVSGSAALPRRRERVAAGLRVRHAGGRQHLGGERRGEAEPEHGLDERAPGEPAGADVPDELANLQVVHRPNPFAGPLRRSLS